MPDVFAQSGDTSGLPSVSELKSIWRAGSEGVMNEMTCGESAGPVAVRKWIGDVSAERVGQMWRAEDHEALLRAMRAADELTLALVALARRESLEPGVNENERTDGHGVRSKTEQVGVDVSAGGD